MSINIDQNTVRASIVAAKQYSTTIVEGDNRHRANILVHENGRDYCAGIRFVCVTISLLSDMIRTAALNSTKNTGPQMFISLVKIS